MTKDFQPTSKDVSNDFRQLLGPHEVAPTAPSCYMQSSLHWKLLYPQRCDAPVEEFKQKWVQMATKESYLVVKFIRISWKFHEHVHENSQRCLLIHPYVQILSHEFLTIHQPLLSPQCYAALPTKVARQLLYNRIQYTPPQPKPTGGADVAWNGGQRGGLNWNNWNPGWDPG